jgi:uncharacterized membrane protein
MLGLRTIKQRIKLPRSLRPRTWGVIGALTIIALLSFGLFMIDLRNPPDILRFIGRFHPVVVHFPIGMIILGGIMEGVAAVYRPLRPLRRSTLVVFALGSVTALVSVVAGYLLSLEGGYDPALVRLHMWLGIAVLTGAAATTMLKLRLRRSHRAGLERAYYGVLMATMGAVTLTGHLGGSLTHGSGYLTYYLPDGVKRLIGPSNARAAETRITNIDSAVVYRDLVVPVLTARCTSCHNPDKLKGGLELSTPEGLIKGGDNGAVIVGGSPDDSELLRRITRPPGQKGFMPADGAVPLDVGETELIRWWIANGASFDQQVADIEEMPTAVATLLRRVAPERPEKRAALYTLVADSVSPKVVAAVRNAGYMVREVAADLPLLQVTAVNIRPKVGDAELKQLIPIATQLTWLDLSGTHVGDAGMAVIAKMPNLTRLYLQGTTVGDQGLKQLKGLKHLEYLNLDDTAVTDAGLEHLAGVEGLRSVYLWRTKVTPAGATKLQDTGTALHVALGAGDSAVDSQSAPTTK